MIYLDYAANTPVAQQVLDVFGQTAQQYIANPNAAHRLGKDAHSVLERYTQQIKELLRLPDREIVYTSGATEANNLAIKGVAEWNKKYGKHMITTYLEHSSVNGAFAALQKQGFEIDYVNITKQGSVDLEHLQELMRSDTILVSVCAIDSETGMIPDIRAVGTLVTQNPHCTLHVDATQAIGKLPIDLSCADLFTFAPHKFYGLNGCGTLVKKESVLLEPQIHGGISDSPYRSGTPVLAMIAATAKALELAIGQLEQRYSYVSCLNKQLRGLLSQFPILNINSPADASPFILNISLPSVRVDSLIYDLSEQGVYLSSKSACCAPNTVSRPVFALTKDRKIALSTLRISLSHLTTEDELNEFIRIFKTVYQKYIK